MTFGTIEASDGTKVEYGGAGLDWTLGLGLAWMW